MPTCPSCNRSHTVRRGEIGAIDTAICDQCYYERFAGQPSEASYFTKDQEFWNNIEWILAFSEAKRILSNNTFCQESCDLGNPFVAALLKSAKGAGSRGD